MLNFCTLFDKNYFYKGLTMYRSLVANCSEDFNLWVLCMDDLTYELLTKMCLPSVKLVSLKEFESPELLKVKTERSVAEYSWTCASNFIRYLMSNERSLEMVVYLDADLYFFNDPKVLVEELGDNDIMITEHRYTGKYAKAAITNGKYCVQFMVFKNNKNGLAVLDWWRLACLDWCFNYLDNNRFGDQKYLDDWMMRFKGVYELQNLGGGVAPWNVQQYLFETSANDVNGRLKNSKKTWSLIFYHFHGFSLVSFDKYLPTNYYDLSAQVKQIIYLPYFKALQKSISLVKVYDSGFSFGYSKISYKERVYYWFKLLLNKISSRGL